MRLKNTGLISFFFLIVLLILFFTSNLTIFDTQTFLQSELLSLSFTGSYGWLSIYCSFFLLLNLVIDVNDVQRVIRLRTRSRVLVLSVNKRLLLAFSLVFEIFLYCIFLVTNLTGSGKGMLLVVLSLQLLFDFFWLVLLVFLVEILSLFMLNRLVATFLVWIAAVASSASLTQMHPLQLSNLFLFDNTFIQSATSSGKFAFPAFSLIQWLSFLAGLYLFLLYFSKRQVWL